MNTERADAASRPAAQPVGRAARAPWLTLWDETSGRLVRFRDVEGAVA